MSDNLRTKKYRQTKQIVRMALNDGWTQTKIAKQCRTQQSIVSKWYNGESLATESQLTPLLEIYSEKLRRKSFRVYRCIKDGTKKYYFHRLEGKIILSSIIHKMQGKIDSHIIYDKFPKKTNFKVIVHYQGNNNFRVVTQQNINIINEISGTEYCYVCDDDDIHWVSSISPSYNIQELLNHMDKMSRGLNETNSHVTDQSFIISFLIRKALLNHGFTVEDVVDLPATW